MTSTHSDHISQKDRVELVPHLNENVRLLGELLGDAIRAQGGESLFQMVEDVRRLSIAARSGQEKQNLALHQKLVELSSDDMYHLARAFNLFLNLSNIADQYEQLRLHKALDWDGLDENAERPAYQSSFCKLNNKFASILESVQLPPGCTPRWF